MFPKTYYSGRFGTLTVTTELQENAARAAGFEEKQKHEEFPRVMYHANEGAKIIASQEEKEALGEEWKHQPITE